MSANRILNAEQPIYLVHMEVLHDNKRKVNKLNFHVLGTKKKIYKVSFPAYKIPKCSCADCVFRKTICKHIHFICKKIMQISATEWENVENLEDITKKVEERLPHLAREVLAEKNITDAFKEYCGIKTDKHLLNDEEKVNKKDETEDEEFKIRNLECCVCLTDFTDEEKTIIRSQIMVCPTCINGIHVECWSTWKQINKTRKCVYCRTDIITKNSKLSHCIVRNSEWGLLVEDA